MARLVAGVLATSTIVACDEQPGSEESVPDTSSCIVRWSGALATDATTFNVEVCWNGSCASDLLIGLPQGDGGVPRGGSLTDCMMATRGGLPSSCTYTPGPECWYGLTSSGVYVGACVADGSEGTGFGIVLVPGPRISDGQSLLRIETSDGTALVQSTARVPGDVIALDGSCLSEVVFDLEGNRLVE
jgi:hypothetical protein